MRQALIIAVALAAAFALVALMVDFRMAVAIGFSATTIIACVNCLTFLWLWYVRATSLALGMALTWGGQAALSFWWFASELPRRTPWLDGSPIVFLILSLYIVGGGIHISVINHSIASRRVAMLWPTIAVVAIGCGVMVGR